MTTINIPAAVKRATLQLDRDGSGATVNVKHAPDPTSGYVVGDGRHERKIALEYPHLPRFVEIDSADEIRRFAQDHLATLAQPGFFLGIWLDDGTLFLDVVNVYAERAAAHAAAVDHGEAAYFCLDTGVTTYV